MTCFTDRVSIHQIHEANGVLHGSEKVDQHDFAIFDLLDADLTQVTLTEVEEPAATDSVLSDSLPSIRLALVARETHSLALCRHYRKTLHEFDSPWECRIFTSMPEALTWAEA